MTGYDDGFYGIRSRGVQKDKTGSRSWTNIEHLYYEYSVCGSTIQAECQLKMALLAS